MTTYRTDDGLIVNDDGELLEIPEGGDVLHMVAQRLAEAKEQADLVWKPYFRALSQVVLNKQAERQAAYGDIVLTIKSSSRTNTDMDRLRSMLEEVELTRDDWKALALAAKDFDPKRLNDQLLEIVDEFRSTKPTDAWVEPKRIRKLGPERIEE